MCCQCTQRYYWYRSMHQWKVQGDNRTIYLLTIRYWYINSIYFSRKWKEMTEHWYNRCRVAKEMLVLYRRQVGVCFVCLEQIFETRVDYPQEYIYTETVVFEIYICKSVERFYFSIEQVSANDKLLCKNNHQHTNQLFIINDEYIVNQHIICNQEY